MARDGGGDLRTKDDDVQNKDNETNDTASRAVLPCVSVTSYGEGGVGDGSSGGQKREAKLEKEAGDEVLLQHDDRRFVSTR